MTDTRPVGGSPAGNAGGAGSPSQAGAHHTTVHEKIVVVDASVVDARHDQQRESAHRSRRAVDEVFRCRGKAFRNDVVLIGPALAAEQQSRPQLDPDRLSHTLSALARKHQVPGAQLAIHHGGETVAIEVGELEYGTGNRVTQDAAFPVGSVTKTYTATVAMVLVADRELELDAPLGEHLPELGDLGNKLTLRQVLSHTSGLAAGANSEEPLTTSIRRYVLDHCRSQNLVLPPGTGFSYSNVGYVLAGHLIETITGMSWQQAMESILLWPLEIEPTFIGAAGHQPFGRPIATGHSVNATVGRTRPATQLLPLAEAPAGGLAVSAMDLVALGLTQLDGRGSAPLPAAYAQHMRQAVSCAEPFGVADAWGLGLAIFRNGGSAWVGHDGNADGTACYLRVDPVNGSIVAFTSNANTGLGMWQGLLPELCRVGLPIESYPTVETLGPLTTPPRGCVGSYRNGHIEYSVTLHENGKHCLVIDGEAVAWLTFHGNLIFSQQDIASGEWVHPGRFLRDPITGNLDGILVSGRAGRRRSTMEKNGPCAIAAQATAV
jgi:CubicO group peptidase (beta-lactamase class C family)